MHLDRLADMDATDVGLLDVGIDPQSLVSSTLALTHRWLGSTIDTIGWPAATVAPTATGTAMITPSKGAITSTRLSALPRNSNLGWPFWATPICVGSARVASTSL